MALKIDIEDLEMILAASKVPQDKQKLFWRKQRLLLSKRKN